MGVPVLEKKAETKMAEYSVASSRKPDVKKVYWKYFPSLSPLIPHLR